MFVQNMEDKTLLFKFFILIIVFIVSWLFGFLWHKVHKGHTAPDKLNQKVLINKSKNKDQVT